MKKLTRAAVLTAIVSFALILTSCGGGGSQSPEAVAKKYIAAVLKQDFSTMKKYASQDEVKKIEGQEADMASQDIPAEKKEFLDVLATAKTDVQPAVINEDDNEALVDIKYVMKVDGEESDGVWKMVLIKEEGDWKVDQFSMK